MSENIQEIIKKVAERYNLDYDHEGNSPKVIGLDGSVREITIHQIESVINIQSEWASFPDSDITFVWKDRDQSSVLQGESKYEFGSPLCNHWVA